MMTSRVYQYLNPNMWSHVMPADHIAIGMQDEDESCKANKLFQQPCELWFMSVRSKDASSVTLQNHKPCKKEQKFRAGRSAKHDFEMEDHQFGSCFYHSSKSDCIFPW